MTKRNSLQQHKRSDKIKWIIVFVLVALLICAVSVLGVILNRQITTVTLGPTAYAVGTLDETGEYKQDNTSIYTKDFVTVDGLQVKLAEKSAIQYKLYFYGENEKQEKTFISATEYLTTNFDVGSIPTNAKFVKVVIQPTADTDVSLLEVPGYANQLEVTHNR